MSESMIGHPSRGVGLTQPPPLPRLHWDEIEKDVWECAVEEGTITVSYGSDPAYLTFTEAKWAALRRYDRTRIIHEVVEDEIEAQLCEAAAAYDDEAAYWGGPEGPPKPLSMGGENGIGQSGTDVRTW